MVWTFFLKKNRFTLLAITALIGFGAYSAVVIPKESAPDISIPIGIVTTVFPGATALDVETLVTNEIERGLSGRLGNVQSITSNSLTGVSSVVVEFNSGTNLDRAISELTREVDRLRSQLPNDANDPIVTEVNFQDQPIATIAIASNALSPKDKAELAEQVKRELERVSGVARVDISGTRPREISIIVTEATLQQFNLSITDIVNNLRALNTTLPVGRITTGDTSYAVAFSDVVTDAESILSLPISTASGLPIALGDIATVIDGVSETTTLSRISIDNNPSESSFTLQVYNRPGGDIGRISAAVQERLKVLEEPNGLLAPYTVYTVLDVGEQNATDLRELVITGIQTVFFVILVLLITIGWREGLIAGLAIPLSFLIGFIGLYVSGNTINFISLFALILGVGILVDSGIVMVEGINKRLKADINADKTKAAYDAVATFASPLTAGTLTTVAMFAGLFVVSGVTGQFIASIPFTLIFVLFASLLVALGFLPYLSTIILKRRNSTKLEQKQTAYAEYVEGRYRIFLTTILHSRKMKLWFATGLLVGFVSALMLPVFGAVKVVFFEQTDIDFVFVDIELLEGSTLVGTDVVARQVEEVLYTHTDYVDGFSLTIGAGNAFSGEPSAGGGGNTKLASFFINLRADRPGSSSDFVDILRDTLPKIDDARITASQPNNGPPVGNPIQVKITGEDLTQMTLVTTQVEQLLASIPNTINVRSSNSNNTTELIYQFDPLLAARYGLTPLSVSSLLRSAVSGTEATSINTLTTDIPVVVRLSLNNENVIDVDQARSATPEALLAITAPSPTGLTVPVSTFGTIGAREAMTSIQHEDQLRIMTVGADITAIGNVMDINRTLREKLDELSLPAGISVSIGGENEESNQAFGELFLALIVGIVLMIAVLILQFNSFRYTFYVLSIIPFSLIGIMYGLAITQNSLSFPSIMGFIALTGIIVNNSILLIDKMNRLRLEFPDMATRDIVIDASVNRLRPIILTTITTVIGMVPLLTSDPIWVPLAFAVIFGLAFSVVITLILIPIIYAKWPGKVT